MSNAKQIARALREEKHAKGFSLLLFPYLYIYICFPIYVLAGSLEYFGFVIPSSKFWLMFVVSAIFVIPLMFIYSRFFAATTKLLSIGFTLYVAFYAAKKIYISTSDYSYSILGAIVICLISAGLHFSAFLDLSYMHSPDRKP